MSSIPPSQPRLPAVPTSAPAATEVPVGAVRASSIQSGLDKIDLLHSAIEDARTESVRPAVIGIDWMDTVSFWVGMPATVLGTANTFIHGGRDFMYFSEGAVAATLGPLGVQIAMYGATEALRGPKRARAIGVKHSDDIAALADTAKKATGLELAWLTNRAAHTLTAIATPHIAPKRCFADPRRLASGVTEGPAVDALRAVVARRSECTAEHLLEAERMGAIVDSVKVPRYSAQSPAEPEVVAAQVAALSLEARALVEAALGS